MIEGDLQKRAKCQEVQGYCMEQMERGIFETITSISRKKIQHEMTEGKSTSFSNWRSCDH